MTTEGGGHDCAKVLESEPPLPKMQGLDGRDRDRDRELIVEELMSLRNRVEELELENARMASHMENCPCQKMLDSDLGLGSCEDTRGNNMSQQDDSGSSNSLYDGKPIRCAEKKSRHKISGCYQGVLHHHAKRYIALKIMYFGQRFYGFASEAQMDPTIESEIFKALAKTKLLVGDKEKSCYSRCGRTDKGVSSIGQVISLFVRSNLKDTGGHEDTVETGPEYICEEIDYVKVLNRVLPKDIRVIGWCPAPPNFHARFSCLSRQYKYLFWREDLHISAMDLASKKFIGEHDFRNFCKMDAANVHNYKRQITSFEISSCNQRSDCKEVWAMTIRGSAFLWHQVRCMVAVLFMIGQGLESPTVIDELLDINKTPRKPQYVMAAELPLILESCEFNGLHFVCSSDAGQALHEHLKNEFQTFMLQATFFHEALSSVSIPGRSPLEHCKKKGAHIPLMSRPTEPSYEERRAKLSMRANCKNLPANKPLKEQRIDYAEFDHTMLRSLKSR